VLKIMLGAELIVPVAWETNQRSELVDPACGLGVTFQDEPESNQLLVGVVVKT
jgi:hypothetical protein